jgi:hypothetical protein
MHRFRIIPKDAIDTSFEIDGVDGSAALNVVSRTPYCEADVWRDGRYAFSVRKEGLQGVFWAVFRKPELARPLN